MSSAVLLAVSLTLSAASAGGGDDVRWVIASVANVREAPSAEAKLVAKLGIGAKVVVKSCAEQFCRIDASRAGVSGYVADSLLDSSPPNYPALVAGAVRSLERACALSPDNIECLSALEDAYRAGNNDEAAKRVAIVKKRKQQREKPARIASRDPQVHDVGEHHGEEASARDGEEWFALCDGRFRRVKVSVKPVRDGILDEPNGPMTGREVSAPCEAEVLLRGIPGFDVAKVRRAKQLDDGSFELGKQRLALRGEPGQAVLVEMTSGERQPVGELDLVESGQPSVLFAGDLDGDGKLDLVARFSEHYNVRALHLFLSSASEGGWAPNKVHEHRDTGC